VNEIRRSWVRDILLPTMPSNWNSWNVLLSPTIFIHNYKNQIILDINIDFCYKAIYNYHQLVSLLFSLHDCTSLNQNDDWCPFASRMLDCIVGRKTVTCSDLSWHKACVPTSILIKSGQRCSGLAIFMTLPAQPNYYYPTPSLTSIWQLSRYFLLKEYKTIVLRNFTV